jgi:magnesium chelatase family protein
MDVPRVEYEKLSDERMGEASAAIQVRVEAARERQRQRFGGTGLMSNADALAAAGIGRPRYASSAGWMRPVPESDTGGGEPAAGGDEAAPNERPGLRRTLGVRCILKLARTITDLGGSDSVETTHPSASLRTCLAEAIQYRPRRQT